MRILHIRNIAGVASIISDEQRKLGHRSDVLVFRRHPFQFREDLVVPKWRFLLPKNYEVYHIHNTRKLDLIVPKLYGKKVIVHHHGTELRFHSKSIKFRIARDLADVNLVSTPDLLKHLPEAYWVPNPIQIDRYEAKMSKPQPPLVGYYSPKDENHAEQIGVREIKQALEMLRKRKIKFKESPLTGIPHRHVPSYLQSLSLFIDRLKMGWYGILGCEAALCGTPVIVNIHDDLTHLLPDSAFARSKPKELADQIEDLLLNENLRKRYVQETRRYIITTHDAKTVVEALMKYY